MIKQQRDYQRQLRMPFIQMTLHRGYRIAHQAKMPYGGPPSFGALSTDRYSPPPPAFAASKGYRNDFARSSSSIKLPDSSRSVFRLHNARSGAGR